MALPAAPMYLHTCHSTATFWKFYIPIPNTHHLPAFFCCHPLCGVVIGHVCEQPASHPGLWGHLCSWRAEEGRLLLDLEVCATFCCSCVMGKPVVMTYLGVVQVGEFYYYAACMPALFSVSYCVLPLLSPMRLWSWSEVAVIPPTCHTKPGGGLLCCGDGSAMWREFRKMKFCTACACSVQGVYRIPAPDRHT